MGVSEANALCMQCGLCCDGTFYGSVVIEDAELPRLARVGLRVIRDVESGVATMAQPCSALQGCLCAVYEERPAACARYECSLRKKLAVDGCTLDAALACVSQMRALLVRIRVGLECPESLSIWERILQMDDPTTPEEAAAASQRYGDAITAVGELLALGRASFEPRFAGGGTR